MESEAYKILHCCNFSLGCLFENTYDIKFRFLEDLLSFTLHIS